MTDANDKSNKMNRRQAGRKKVIKSPARTSSTQNEGKVDNSYCPCKDYMDVKLPVGCENCGEYWHLCCVGLKGLTMEMVGLAPKPKKDSATDQKKAEDMEFCRNVLKIPSKDLDTCWRAGKIDNSNPDYSRPLKLKNEGLVQEWTKDGKGYRTDSGHWINKDLCAADRK
ncbi:hypothetical protein ACHWQZ_G010608 [Mnemiopsis leidyi]